MEWPERLSLASKRNLVVIGNQYSDDTLISPVTSEAMSRARRTGRTCDRVLTLPM